MSFVVDVSFAEEELTAAKLISIGATGAIGYISPDPSKNLSKERFEDWINSGLDVALAFENITTDALGGYDAGLANADMGIQQAITLGYDQINCVLFFAADMNTQVNQLELCEEYFRGISHAGVQRPGAYGNKLMLDDLWTKGLIDVAWQSDSTAFSGGLVSKYAALLQMYNDSRVVGLSADANVLLGPLTYMMKGIDMLPAESAMLTDIHNWLGGGVAPGQVNEGSTIAATLQGVQSLLNKVNAMNVQAITAAVIAALPPQLNNDTLNAQAVADAVIKEMSTKLGAA